MTEERTDAELLSDHCAGDDQAFSTLVSRHQDRLWRLALRTMRNAEDAADALQDAYISAFRRAHTFRGDAQVTTWLHRIVVNACLDRIRRKKVRQASALPENLDRWDTMATPSNAERTVEERSTREQVAAALNELNSDQRAALILVDMEGYSVEEAATILGCASGTIKSRCSRGRGKLAELLKNLHP